MAIQAVGDLLDASDAMTSTLLNEYLDDALSDKPQQNEPADLRLVNLAPKEVDGVLCVEVWRLRQMLCDLEEALLIEFPRFRYSQNDDHIRKHFVDIASRWGFRMFQRDRSN